MPVLVDQVCLFYDLSPSQLAKCYPEIKTINNTK